MQRIVVSVVIIACTFIACSGPSVIKKIVHVPTALDSCCRDFNSMVSGGDSVYFYMRPHDPNELVDVSFEHVSYDSISHALDVSGFVVDFSTLTPLPGARVSTGVFRVTKEIVSDNDSSQAVLTPFRLYSSVNVETDENGWFHLVDDIRGDSFLVISHPEKLAIRFDLSRIPHTR